MDIYIIFASCAYKNQYEHMQTETYKRNHIYFAITCMRVNSWTPLCTHTHTRVHTRTDTHIQICLYQYLCFYFCVSSPSVVCREIPFSNTRFHSVFIMKINLQSVGIDLSSMNCLFNSSLLRFFSGNVNINFVRGNVGN